MTTAPGTSPAPAPGRDAAAPGSPTGAGAPEPRFERVTVRGPALVVLGIAVFILIAGAVASALATSAPATLALRSITIPDGTVVGLTPAATALAPIVDAQPPSDILANLAVPAGSHRTGWVNSDQGTTLYDRWASFTTGLASDQVVSLYRTLLPRLGWKITYQGPASSGVPGETAGATELLASRGSNDGYYWEVGAVVAPGASSGTTAFTVVLYEQSGSE